MSIAVSVLKTPSLYIPRIDFKFTKNELKSSFEEMTNVTVTRVDFVSFNSEKGVGRSAYIHFNKWSLELENMYAMIQSDGYILTIISSQNVSEQIRLLINADSKSGTYHGTNCEAASWHELAQSVLDFCGTNSERVKPVKTLKNANLVVWRSYYKI